MPRKKLDKKHSRWADLWLPLRGEYLSIAMRGLSTGLSGAALRGERRSALPLG